MKLMVNEIGRKTALPVFSLVVTFTLLYFLFQNVEKLNAGDHSTRVFASIIGLALALFIVPLFFSSKRKHQKKPIPQPLIEKKQFRFRLIKRVKLDTDYHPTPKIHCPHCNGANPTFAKLCFFCGRNMFD